MRRGGALRVRALTRASGRRDVDLIAPPTLAMRRAAALLFVVGLCAGAKKKKRAASAAPGEAGPGAVSLSSGLQLAFSDTPAAPALRRWAASLERAGGTVSHGEAVHREAEVRSSLRDSCARARAR